MTKLKIFTSVNNIYAGINTPQFSQLEYLIELSKQTGCNIPNLGLFGEASTGKTTAAKILAKAAGYDFYVYNAINIKSINDFYDELYEKFYDITNGNLVPFKTEYHLKIPKCVILIDEAHKLKEDIQTSFLTSLDNGGVLYSEGRSIISEDITWIFATTNPSSLIYPLYTRLHSMVLDQYTLEDIKQIIKLKYPLIEDTGLEILAQCSKLVPRTAIRNAGLLVSSFDNTTSITTENVKKFVIEFLNMETNGIDQIDKRILAYLINYQRKCNPADKIALAGFSKVKECLEQKGNLSLTEHKQYNVATFQIMMLTEKLKSAPPRPKSRQDISLALRLLDLTDLELRLSYLEKLNMIVKGSRGITIAEQYRTIN